MSHADRRHPGLNLGNTDQSAHEAAEEEVFGFWVFLMSDLVLFALLFATYAAMTGSTAGGPAPKDVFELKSVAIETAVLLTSSFSFGMASLAMKYQTNLRQLVLWLLVTLALGLAFLGLELHDFFKMFSEGAFPSRSGFLSAFFALVPTHGLHVSFGIVWLLALLAQIKVHGLDRQVKLGILRLGLFWHLLDVVWIGIFSVVYLQGLAS